jgi:ribonuclease PH
MNVVMRDDAFVEIQGTGEEGVFSRSELNDLLDSAGEGIYEIMRAQRSVLGLEKQ